MKMLISVASVLSLLSVAAHADSKAITKEEVLAAQQAWSDGIVAISKTFVDKGDYKARAAEHIKTLYAYEQGGVLFKPTLAADDQFRETYDQAFSYFVGGDIKEDKGFAIKPWSKVRWEKETQNILTDSDSALAMGNYYFTPVGDTKETKVEYTFGYIKDAEGKVRINLHHSSLPFSK